MSHHQMFENKSIQHLIVLFSLPTIFSLVLESLVSIIDTVFAGHLGEMSSVALSAMGLLTPILQVLLAAQLIFGVSTSIVMSKRLGENDKTGMNDTFYSGFYGCTIFSLLISGIILFFQQELLVILGASGQVFELAQQYLRIALLFNIFNSIGYMLVNIIRVFGYPKMEVIIGIVSTISNIFFNVLFTFVFGLGIRGIAFATLVSSMIYFGFSVIFLLKKGLWMKRSSLEIRRLKCIVVDIVKIGFVQFLMQALNSVSGFVMNKSLIHFGNLDFVGAWAICNNINMVILLPLIGLTQGVQSIIAYFHGRNEKQKEADVKRKVMKYGIVYSAVVTIFSYVFAAPLLEIFTSDVALVNIGIRILKIIVLGFPFMGIIYTIITFMQVSGHEGRASRLELIRQLILLIPLVLILPWMASSFGVSKEVMMFSAVPLANILIVLLYVKQVRNLFEDG